MRGNESSVSGSQVSEESSTAQPYYPPTPSCTPHPIQPSACQVSDIVPRRRRSGSRKRHREDSPSSSASFRVLVPRPKVETHRPPKSPPPPTADSLHPPPHSLVTKNNTAEKNNRDDRTGGGVKSSSGSPKVSFCIVSVYSAKTR